MLGTYDEEAAVPRKATVRARGLGVELKEMRSRSGLTTTEVGNRLDWSASTVSRIETGKRGVTSEEVAAMMVVYQAPADDRQRLIDLAREADRPGWWECGDPGLPSQLTALISFESQATVITDVALVLIPGLLQTPEYARAVMAATGIQRTVAETRVAARLGRQAILKEKKGPSLRAFIDEAALRRPLGGPDVMLDQIEHLIQSSRDPRISIRALPQTSDGHIALNGSFTVIEFEKAQALVHLEHKRSSLFLDDPKEVDAFLTDIATLDETSLDPLESIDFLAEIAQGHKRE